MTMYQIIAAEYDNLFPHTQNKTDFVESQITEGTKKILDLGCATGELLLSLYKPDRILTGIDLDEIMIKMARGKAFSRKALGIDFVTHDMVSYLENLDSSFQDMLLCFGNTLAYLADPPELECFFENAYRVLSGEGQFIIQILNFDNPEIGAGFNFPDLNTANLTFSRSYSEGSGGGISFNMEIYQRDSQKRLKETHRLFPFTTQQIKKAAEKACFKNCRSLGGYNREKTKLEDFSHLFILEK